MVVSEAGASVYSASKLAAEEFPEFDVTLRSAVSIARRLQDPLAELVKIDPKAIGVGQYQHDMPQKRSWTRRWAAWWRTVSTQVGVDLNTAVALAAGRVSGSSALPRAKNIVRLPGGGRGLSPPANQLKKVKSSAPRPMSSARAFCACPRRREPAWTPPLSTPKATKPPGRFWSLRLHD